MLLLYNPRFRKVKLEEDELAVKCFTLAHGKNAFNVINNKLVTKEMYFSVH